MIYVWLFFINVFISTFTFGGGYVVIPMIEKYFVDRKQLFKKEELLEMAAIAQSSPGAIAINLSALAGYRCKGVYGAGISCLGAILPPLLLISGLSLCYDMFYEFEWIRWLLKGMEAGAVTLIIDLLYTMISSQFHELETAIFLLLPITFIAIILFHFPILPVILGGILYCVFLGWKRGKQ